jgi:outer membrane receptor protein involved in Fe transport
MAIGRMGGHGLEPRLRGMGETNINVLLDGAYVHNACPNRMDPPTSFGAVDSFDRVVVLKGVQTVRYGGGGSAGTVLYQRETPRFQPSEDWRLAIGSSWATHAETPDLTIDAAIGTPTLYLRAIGEKREMGNYEDGAGNEVRSAFNKQDVSFAFGWTPDDLTALELSFENNLTEDSLFPGAAMDAPFDENSLYRLQLRRLRAGGTIIAIESDLYFGLLRRDRPRNGQLLAPPLGRSPGGQGRDDLGHIRWQIQRRQSGRKKCAHHLRCRLPEQHSPGGPYRRSDAGDGFQGPVDPVAGCRDH